MEKEKERKQDYPVATHIGIPFAWRWFSNRSTPVSYRKEKLVEVGYRHMDATCAFKPNPRLYHFYVPPVGINSLSQYEEVINGNGT